MPEHLKINSSGMQCIGAYRAVPPGTPKGGIVVIQEIFGVNAHVRDLVVQFANAGYVAIAPAFFDHVESDVELDYDAAGIARGRALIAELDIDQVMADVGSAANSIRSAGRIGVVGYCWGGTIAMLAASRLGLPAVSYYGARNVAWLHETFTAPLQFHFGKEDRSIPPEAIERHRQCLPDAEIYLYPAGHGFNCDLRKDFAPKSAALARERTLAFFEKNLGRSDEA
ncbi:MAG: dienelactone hydrolase family protein [Xanthomonadales bacterium]|nr:dienelactone hydrolase family protein [Xanthomonadales bacterium]